MVSLPVSPLRARPPTVLTPQLAPIHSSAGKYHDPTTDTCIDCRARTFAEFPGLTTCAPCKSDETSEAGASYW